MNEKYLIMDLATILAKLYVQGAGLSEELYPYFINEYIPKAEELYKQLETERRWLEEHDA